MKLVILACLAAAALAAPQEPRPIETLRDERTDEGNGQFSYVFETENGIFQDVKGYPAETGGQAITGEYSFPLEDGRIAHFTFTADENGYRPESDLIPVAPPTPEHVLRTLEIVAQLERDGATWDDQGNRLTRK